MLRDFRRQEVIDGRDLKVFFRLELSELKRSATGRVVLDPVDCSIDPQLPDAWKQAFDFVFSKYAGKAKRKALLSWSHGAGFGINKEDSPIIREKRDKFVFSFKPDIVPASEKEIVVVRNNMLFTIDQGEEIKKFHFNVGDEAGLKKLSALDDLRLRAAKEPPFVCKNLEIVWIWELRDVIKKSLGKDKLEFILMMNCNMQLFDTGYILKEVTKYLVAPETKMYWFGYAYDKLFETFEKNPTISTRNLLSSIVTDYVKKYENDPEAKQYLEASTLFINRLANYHSLLRILGKSLTHTLPLMQENSIETFRQIRTKHMESVTETDQVNSYDMVDMGNWFRMLSKTFRTSIQLRYIHFQYKIRLRRIVYKKFIGSLYLEHDQAHEKKYGISGISLYFPEEQPFSSSENVWGNCAYYSKDILPSPFTKVSNWDEFIKKYYSFSQPLVDTGGDL